MEPRCKYCGGKLWKKRNPRGIIGRTQFQCRECRKYQRLISRHPRTARILLMDIETSYMDVRGIWDLKTEYIQPNRVVKDWSVLCYAAKWLFEPKILGESVTPKEALERTEMSVLGGIWKLLDQADIVVTQNGLNFDIKRLNTKFIKYGYPPPSSYSVVDTLKVARDKFAFYSNSLDELGKTLLGIGGKTKMSIEDWDACVEGNKKAKKALDKMLSYCKRDVAPLLEDLYLTFLPWITSHPNLGIYSQHDGDVCPKCESQNLLWTEQYATPQGLWEGFRCQSCGTTGRGTRKEHSVKKVSIK